MNHSYNFLPPTSSNQEDVYDNDEYDNDDDENKYELGDEETFCNCGNVCWEGDGICIECMKDEEEEENDNDDDYEDEDEEEEEDEEEDEEEEEDEDENNYIELEEGEGYCSCSNICLEDIGECALCNPKAYRYRQFRYCEAVLVHETYSKFQPATQLWDSKKEENDVDAIYGYDRSYKYNLQANEDHSNPNDYQLADYEQFCNYPECMKIINTRHTYCRCHR